MHETRRCKSVTVVYGKMYRWKMVMAEEIVRMIAGEKGCGLHESVFLASVSGSVWQAADGSMTWSASKWSQAWPMRISVLRFCRLEIQSSWRRPENCAVPLAAAQVSCGGMPRHKERRAEYNRAMRGRSM